MHKVTPHYRVIHESGPDHDKTFRIQLEVCEVVTQGVGKNKKMAEQEAAGKAIEILQKE